MTGLYFATLHGELIIAETVIPTVMLPVCYSDIGYFWNSGEENQECYGLGA